MNVYFKFSENRMSTRKGSLNDHKNLIKETNYKEAVTKNHLRLIIVFDFIFLVAIIAAIILDRWFKKKLEMKDEVVIIGLLKIESNNFEYIKVVYICGKCFKKMINVWKY